jgi:ACS family glucarate transporter-like MFS transporter
MRKYLVVASIFILSLITYIDRAAISSAKGAIATDLSLSDSAMGAVFSAFALGYAMAQIPSGWFADKFGPRIALTAVVTLWSLFTALTGAVSRFATLLAVRFLFGVAEAGAFPGSARVFYNWLSAGERGLANGILFSGALLGGGVAFPFYAWLLGTYGWRGAFYFLAVPGLAWALGWLLWFRDHPPRPVQQAAVFTPDPPFTFGQVFRSKAMVLVMFQYFAGNFTFFICISWMYPYLSEHYSLSHAQAAGYSMIPLLSGSTANWVAGFLVDLFYRSGRLAWSRRMPAIFGFLLAATGILLVTGAGSPETAVAAFALAMFGVEMTISPSWAYCLDIGGKKSGALSGAMNMVGNFGGFVSANAFPYLQRLTGSTDTYFRTAAVLNTAAILCWLWLRPKSGKPSFEQSPGGTDLVRAGLKSVH